MRTIKKLLAAAFLAGGLGLLILAYREGRLELAQEAEMEAPIKAPARVSAAPAGEPVVTVRRDVRSRIGLATVALVEVRRRPEVVAYGQLAAAPSERYVLRATVRGVLQAAASVRWPQLGDALRAGTVLGAVQPLLGPVERVDLGTQLAAARAQVEEYRARLAASRASFDHKRALNASGGIVSDRAVEEAEAQVRADQARLDAAGRMAQLIETTLSPGRRPIAPAALRVEHGGEVVEVFAQPEEVVDAGQPILRLARFDRLLARVELPAAARLDAPLTAARLVVLGHEDQPLESTSISPAPSVDPRTRGQAFLLRVAPGGFPLRPGAAVTAYLTSTKAAASGVMIPRSAVVRMVGRAWAYVQVGEQEFTRREVALDQPTTEGWWVTSGFVPGQRVVSTGAQMLVSEELKSRIRVGEEQK